jgi:hypothetical protein
VKCPRCEALKRIRDMTGSKTAADALSKIPGDEYRANVLLNIEYAQAQLIRASSKALKHHATNLALVFALCDAARSLNMARAALAHGKPMAKRKAGDK